MIQTRHNNLNTGTINLSETKEKFLENILREISPQLTDKQYNTLRIVLVNELGKVEILDPLRGYDERLEDECDKLLELFIRTKRLEGKSERTLSFYKDSAEKLFKFLNNKPVSLITADDIRGFLSDRINQGISMTTANNLRRNLSSFFTWCFNEDYILKSPMIKIKPFKELKDVKKEFTDTEIETLRKKLNEDIYTSEKGTVTHESALQKLAIFELLLCSGIRVGELVRLNYGDVDFRNKTGIVLGKGNKRRRMFFTDKCKVYLEDYLTQRKINKGEIKYDEPLFCGAKKPYNRLGTNGLERQIRLLGRTVGVKNVHPHRFRRTFATKMINKGMPLEKVQMLLGHESPETTMIYVNVSDKGLAYDFNRYID